jgi:DNA segregation ATPase FtsK/SpoIIIE, S-DNA-T family
VLTRLNDKFSVLFGVLGVLVPFSMIFFSLMLTKIKIGIAKPNVAFGFFVFVLSLIGLFRSGLVGDEFSGYLVLLMGYPVTVTIFIIGILIGFIVFLNISFTQIFDLFKSLFGGILSGLDSITTVFQKKQDAYLDSQKQITIKGLKDGPNIQEKREIPLPAEKKAMIPPSSHDSQNALGDEIVLNKPLEMGMWEYPPPSLLSERMDKKADRGDIKKIAYTIEKTLESFGVKAKVVEINIGPSVTQYALEIALGTKLSKITSLANDLALATEAPTGQIRIEAPIPGRGLVGVEIPNRSLEIVSLKTMLQSSAMQKSKSKLTVPLGLDVAGQPVFADIAKMPHVLVAGTTGSGKSVLINSFIASLLFRAAPTEVKLILIDPKRVELTAYNDIPHLLVPVVVEPEESVSALKWALKEMDKRYREFAKNGVRNIDSYNELAGFQAFPYIVIVIDELADLMALAPVEVEDSIARIAQMARATGIHLVVSTQRPSVDVITGLIKANIPARIAFTVSSMVDSKVIIDTPGAEKLLGRGDMLYVPPDQAKPTRIQGAFVSEQDVKRLVTYIKSKNVPVEYTKEILEQQVNLRKGAGSSNGMMGGMGKDELFEQAVRIVCQHDKASSSLLQRRLAIGFARAARIIDQLEAASIIGPGEGSKPRDVLIKDPNQALNGTDENNL